MALDPAERERLVTDLLDRWPWDVGGVIIGGYAVAAHGAPRYSTDIDIVVKVSTFDAIDAWLLKEGFVRGEIPSNIEQNYAGEGFRYTKDYVTVDILPGVVRDREALVDVPEWWITENAIRTKLVLLESSTRTEVPVCNLTAFWALKLQAGREKDIGDLFVTRTGKIDAKAIQQMFRSVHKPSLEVKLKAVLARLDDPKLLNDVLGARLGVPKRGKIDREALWSEFAKQVRNVVEPLLEEKA